MDRGYLFIGLGESYITEITRLIDTIRKVGDIYPMSIITSVDDVEYCKTLNYFDKIIPIDYTNDLFLNNNNGFEKYGSIPKILMLDMSPYDETIFIDSDVLCQYSTNQVWDSMSSLNQCVTMTGSIHSNDWHFGHINNVSKIVGKSVPMTHAGIIYFKKSHKDLKLFIKTLYDIWENYNEYGLLRLYKNSRIEEPIYAIAFAKLDYVPLEFSETAIMTFNYHADIEIPSNIQTMGKKHSVTYTTLTPISFIHMFKQNSKGDYLPLYNKIMNL
jgi:hypothetical protein